jgi:hypothetical protein
MEDDFIPVLKFASEKGIDKQKIYRAIREHRLKEGVDYKKVKKVVERIYVRRDLEIPKSPYEK